MSYLSIYPISMYGSMYGFVHLSTGLSLSNYLSTNLSLTCLSKMSMYTDISINLSVCISTYLLAIYLFMIYSINCSGSSISPEIATNQNSFLMSGGPGLTKRES